MIFDTDDNAKMASSPRARCNDCGHEWSTRYSPSEYQLHGGDPRLRCPECNQGKKDGFEFIGDGHGIVIQTGCSALDSASFEVERAKLYNALDEAFTSFIGAPIEHVERIGLGEFDNSSAQRVLHADEAVKELTTRLYELATHLQEVDSADELATYSEAIEEVLGDVGTVDRLVER